MKEGMMDSKPIWSNIAMMGVFAAIGLTMFTDNVRSVQVLGLFASGAAFGASLSAMIRTLRAGKKAT
jgi:hypothetical protein